MSSVPKGHINTINISVTERRKTKPTPHQNIEQANKTKALIHPWSKYRDSH